MAPRITALTPEQEALLPVKAAEWIATGLSTQPADRAAAEEGVRAAYRAAKLDPPRVIIWLDSPLAGAYGRALTPLAMAQVRDQVGDQVRAQVGDQVGDQVWAQVRAQVRDQVGAQVRDQVRDQVGNWYIGLVDAWATWWSAWIDVAEGIGVTGLEPFNGIKTVTQNAGWWWCFKDFAIITDRPAELHRDNQNRLHNENGPAIAYRDGFAVHSWHGTRVPADLVTGPGWDTDRILREPNSEIRRCAIERMGWPQFITAAGLEQVGASVPDPGNPGQHIALYDVPERIYDVHVRVLVCTNATRERDGSRHTFGLTVPADISDPVAAAAWTFNVSPEMYAQLVRAA